MEENRAVGVVVEVVNSPVIGAVVQELEEEVGAQFDLSQLLNNLMTCLIGSKKDLTRKTK